MTAARFQSLIAALALGLPALAGAQDAEAPATPAEEQAPPAEAAPPPAPKKDPVTIESLQTELARQQAVIEQQQQINTTAQQNIDSLSKLLETQRRQIQAQQDQIRQQQEALGVQNRALQSLQTQVDQMAGEQDELREPSEEEVAMRERLAKLEKSVSEIPDDPTQALVGEGFPGSLRVPGTNAAFRIGGFAKANFVKNFDPLLTQDRFIVGSIPAGDAAGQSIDSETSLTANQTRLSFDLREATEIGSFRGYVEADFAGSGDTFRLRHGFGQWRQVLAGKTWSVMYDADSAPEELDFEGINGRVIVRQTQLRLFPKIGESWDLAVALEDPSPEVSNGQGVSDIPDLTVSVRRNWFKRWHGKTAFLLRQIRAVTNEDVINAGSTEKEVGWGITISGKTKFAFMPERDNILFQLNYGDGIGRYINDLNAISDFSVEQGGGGQDAYIDPFTGKMRTLEVLAGYISYEHWWQRKGLRSTVTFSMVDVDNLGVQPDNAYNHTKRLTGNLIWSPIPRLDVGGELLWGERENKNGDNETASQIQFATKFRF